MEPSSTAQLPQPHQALEQEIRAIQAKKDPFMEQIPEERLQERIKRVTLLTFQALVAAAQLNALIQLPTLERIASLITQDKDQKAGRLETNQDTAHILTNLDESNIGKESLLRVVHAISSLALQKMLPQQVGTYSLSDIHQATRFFAARPLLEELLQEPPYQESQKK